MILGASDGLEAHPGFLRHSHSLHLFLGVRRSVMFLYSITFLLHIILSDINCFRKVLTCTESKYTKPYTCFLKFNSLRNIISCLISFASYV